MSRTHILRALLLLISMAPIALSMGCATKEAAATDNKKTVVETKVLPSVPDEANGTAQPELGQVILAAEVERDRLQFTLFNNTGKLLIVGPKNFALMFPTKNGKGELIPFGKYESGFSATKLDTSDSIVAHFSIRQYLSRIAGAYLIFNHPMTGMVRARID